jgi:lipoprotein-anchoring transpeptidase ErfK/SrfK
VIKVHKSAKVKVPEYLEVLRQNSANPADVSPINLFDNGTTNRALVSTATGRFLCAHKTVPCITPSGNFNIGVMEVMHYSKAYGNSPMPNTMFFLEGSGIGIHGIPKSEWKDLGRQASHGCVRVHPVNAKLLYDFVKSEGGTKSGAVVQVF